MFPAVLRCGAGGPALGRTERRSAPPPLAVVPETVYSCVSATVAIEAHAHVPPSMPPPCAEVEAVVLLRGPPEAPPGRQFTTHIATRDGGRRLKAKPCLTFSAKTN